MYLFFYKEKKVTFNKKTIYPFPSLSSVVLMMKLIEVPGGTEQAEVTALNKTPTDKCALTLV